MILTFFIIFVAGFITTIPLPFLCSLQHLHTSSAMKIFKLPILKSLWTQKPLYRTFHGHSKLLASDVYSQYQAVRRGEQEIPKYFNFASDVLDKWTEIEKVEIFCCADKIH